MRRVIAGKYKRKLLSTPPGTEVTRPTTARVKENIFNIIQHEISNKIVLDLFSGSGALGIEALSRGAKKVFFVEENKDAITCIKKNLNNLNCELENFVVFQNKVTNFLENKNKQHSEKIDIIFADPPYHTKWYFSALNEIEASGLCNMNCMVVLEMPQDLEISEQKNWTCQDSRKYGKTKIEIWRYQVE
jgi:16S rRNA (guanine966-N2)-methyltransferase